MEPKQPSLSFDDLVGTWRTLIGTFELRADGTANVTTDGDVGTAMWEWIDGMHWKLRTVVAPMPGIVGMEDGAIDVQEFEVTRLTKNGFCARMFDSEGDWEFSRVT